MDHSPFGPLSASTPLSPPVSPLRSPHSRRLSEPSSLPSPAPSTSPTVAYAPTLTLNLATLAAVATASTVCLLGTPDTFSSSAGTFASSSTPPIAAMTVPTLSQDENSTESDRAKSHLRRDQGCDNDRSSLSDARTPSHSYQPPNSNSEDDSTPPIHRRSSSPGRRALPGTPNPFNHRADNHNHIDNNTSSVHDDNANVAVGGSQRCRSGSFDGKEHSAAFNGRRWDAERAPVRPNMYLRSDRSSIEDYEAQCPREGSEGSLGGDGEESSRLQNEQGIQNSSPSRSDTGDEGDVQDDLMYDEDNIQDDDESEENEDGTESRDDSASTKNEDGSDPTARSAGGSRKPVKVRSMFVDKLYRMVEDPSIQHLISWAQEGDMFYVYNCIKLSDTILPKFFKHNNWQSFVRQLNMYGFHKIYRYDREESNMNRKNPETQRWQFYHPHFQRDFPHLRKNIKRKSARSMNTAPATSRVVFEHGKGYFLQRNDRSRSNSGEGGQHSGLAYKSSLPPHHHQHHPQAPPSRHLGQPSPTMRPTTGGRHPSLTNSLREPEVRDSTLMRDSTHQPHEPRSQYPFPRHQQDVRRPGLQQRHQVYPNVHSPERPYALQHVSESPRSSQDPQHHPRPPPPPSYYSGGSGTQAYRPMKPHLMGRDHSEGEAALGGATGVSENFRNHSVPGVDHRKGSLPGQEPDKNHPGAGVHSEGPPSQSGNSTYSAGPSHQPPRTHGSIGDAPRGAMSPRVQQPLESPEDASSVNPTHRHPGDLSDGDERYAAKRGSIATDSAHSSNATHPGQSYGSPQRHHPHPPYHDFQRPDRLHSMGGNKAHKDSPQSTPSLPSGNKYNTLPPPTSHVGAAPIQAMPSPAIPPPISAAAGPAFTSATQHHQQQSSFSLTGHRLPGSPTSPRTTEELENRLHYVEDVCMSLKQHTQKLEQLQASQERTIQWMRERIEQMTDTALARRDSVTSPLTPQSGVMVMANKRKAESIPDDTRNRARYESFGIDGLDQHHHHIHGHGHGHSGPTGPVPGGPGFEGPTRGGYHEQGSAPSAEVQRYQQQQQHTHYQDQHRQHTMIPQMHHQHQQQHQQQQGNHGPQHRAHRPAPAAPGKLYL